MHKATRPNQNESFFISHDRTPDHPEVQAAVPLRGCNQWPGSLPDIRDPMVTAVSRHFLGAMCDRMLPPFARGARHARPDFVRPASSPMTGTTICAFCTTRRRMRAKTICSARRAAHRQQLHDRAGAGTDVPGLAVRLPSGEWRSRRRSSRRTFLINLGKRMMRRWSNNRFLSTPHGVLNESGTDRYSIAYFHSPNPATIIECLPSCVSAADESGALRTDGLPRAGARILPRQLFPSKRPRLRRRRTGRRRPRSNLLSRRFPAQAGAHASAAR